MHPSPRPSQNARHCPAAVVEIARLRALVERMRGDLKDLSERFEISQGCEPQYVQDVLRGTYTRLTDMDYVILAGPDGHLDF